MQLTDPINIYGYLTFNFLINKMKELQKIGPQPLFCKNLIPPPRKATIHDKVEYHDAQKTG
jgi:hypothetical protein